MLVFWALMAVFTFHACTHMVAAGDTWVAMACGRHHLNHGVDTVEPFSANSHDAGPTKESIEKWPQPFRSIAKALPLSFVKKVHPTGWINQNWGTHVTFYWLAKTFGSDGEMNFDMLIVWKFAVNILACIVIYYLGITLGATPALAAVSAALALFVGRTFLDVRPAVYSNLLAPAVLLVMALASHKNIKYIWLMVPLTVFWCNVHGGYIYIFIMLVPFIGLHFFGSLPKKLSLIIYNALAWPAFIVLAILINKGSAAKEAESAAVKIFLMFLAVLIFDIIFAFARGKIVTIKFRDVIHLMAAYLGCLIAALIFNPFHLTNLTHTFEISVSEHAASWRNVNEWHPAFEWENPVGDETAFLVMFIIMWVIFAAWLITFFVCPFSKKKETGAKQRNNRQETEQPKLYEHPKIDIAVITIAVLTLYMAIQSRRFIPIAAAAMCPVMAVFTGYIIKAFSAFMLHHKTGLFTLPAMQNSTKKFVTAIVALITIALLIVWGARFKQIYLDPWPNDAERDSVFMRMTASNVKPHDVGTFIRKNELSGRMYNYWTEGGALAFYQEPDPETGETPLKLFMDGRAQAAYNHNKFILWSYIHSGGPVFHRLHLAGRKPAQSDWQKMADWVDRQMKKFDVWVVVMPSNQLSSNFMRALSRRKNWRTAFKNDSQILLVDTDTDKGKELIQQVVTEKAFFPDDFSRSLTLGHNLIRVPNADAVKKGWEMLKNTLDIMPCQAAMYEVIMASRVGVISDEVNQIITDYLNGFLKDKEELRSKGGYLKRMAAANIAAGHLRSVNRKERAQREKYDRIFKTLQEEFRKISQKMTW